MTPLAAALVFVFLVLNAAKSVGLIPIRDYELFVDQVVRLA